MSGAGIVATKDVRLIHCGLQLLVARGALGSAGETVLEVPAPAAKQTTDSSGHGAGGGAGDGGEGQGQEQLGCAAAAVSPAGDLIAVCDDRKQVCVFRVSDLSLLNQQTLVRKASCVTFSSDGRCVLVGDKNGDVYSVTADPGTITGQETAPRLVLGHLSQLLDIVISTEGDRVITADRDEKVRVSRFPNCYNIDNYCLGHTEFVTSLCVSRVTRDTLLSGSGDGTVRVWNYVTGAERGCRDVTQDIPAEERGHFADLAGEAMDTSDNDNEENTVKRVSPPSQPAVVKIRLLTTTKGEEFAFVQVESSNHLLIYKLLDGQIQFVNKKHVGYLLDFDTCDDQLFILRRDSSSVKMEVYKMEDSLTMQMQMQLDFNSSENQDFFKPTSNYENEGMKNLHKRWFDNVREYFDRKEARIEKKKQKMPLPLNVKKQKCET